MKKLRRLEGNDLVKEYIIYSTAKNIVNRRIKQIPSNKYLVLGSDLADYIHEIKGLMDRKNLKIIKRGETNSTDFYLYTLYNNGWRSDHELSKQTIQENVMQLINNILNGSAFKQRLDMFEKR